MSRLKTQLMASIAQNQKTHSRARVTEREDEQPELVLLPLSKVSVNPFQPRTIFSEEAVRELAESIKSEGLLQPVLVRPNGTRGYELISGERRLRAFQHLGFKEIPAVVRAMSDTESATSSLQENIKREQLTDLEISFSVKWISELIEIESGVSLSVQALAERLGFSRPALYRYLSFQSLPPKALAMLQADPTLMGGTTSLELKRWVESEAKLGKTHERLDDVLCACLELVREGQLTQSAVVKWVQEALLTPEEARQPELTEPAAVEPLAVKWVEGKRVVKVSLNRAQLTDDQLEQIKGFIEEVVGGQA